MSEPFEPAPYDAQQPGDPAPGEPMTQPSRALPSPNGAPLPPARYLPESHASPGDGTPTVLLPSQRAKPKRGRRGLVFLAAAVVVLVALLAGGIAYAAAHGGGVSSAPSAASTSTAMPTKKGADVLTVVSVGADSITATRPDGTTVTIVVSASTSYVRAGQPATLADIVAQTRLHVKGKKNSDGSIAARRIEILVPTLHGKVTAISGDTLVVKGKTVRVTPSTVLLNLSTKQPIHLADITPGEEVRVQWIQNADGTLTALRIVAGSKA